MSPQLRSLGNSSFPEVGPLLEDFNRGSEARRLIDLGRGKSIRVVILSIHNRVRVSFEPHFAACEKCEGRLQGGFLERDSDRQGLLSRLSAVLDNRLSEVAKCDCLGPTAEVALVEIGGGSSERAPRVHVRSVGGDPDRSAADRESDPPRISIKKPSQIRVSPPRTTRRPATMPSAVADAPEARAVAARYRLPSGDRAEVTFTDLVRRALIDHCDESNEHGREIAGLLIGHCSHHATGACYDILVTDALAAETANASGAHVQLSADVWARLEEDFDRSYRSQNKERLGWYHTHPTQGIFFSNQDLDAHSLFRKEYQLALVVDPRSMEAGIFFWWGWQENVRQGPSILLRPSPLLTERASRDRPADPAPAPSRQQVNPTRVVLLLLLISAALGLAIREIHFGILATALLTFVGLRLWNVGWLHGAGRKKGGGSTQAPGGDLGPMKVSSLGRSWLKWLAPFFGLGSVFMLAPRLYELLPAIALPASPTPESTFQVLERVMAWPPMVLPSPPPDLPVLSKTGVGERVEVLLFDRPRFLTVSFDGIELTFPREGDGSFGPPKNGGSHSAEEDLWAKILGAAGVPRALGQEGIKALQTALKISADGQYGWKTRSAVLRKALALAGEDEPLSFPSGASVYFIRNPERVP